jgi:hypothetical protein
MPNVGVDKARDAAVKVGNAIVVTAPEIAERTAADQGTDWNDVAVAKGAQAARGAIQEVMAPEFWQQRVASAPVEEHKPKQSRGLHL